MFCASCGSLIPAGSSACPTCGRKVRSSASKPGSVIRAAIPQQQYVAPQPQVPQPQAAMNQSGAAGRQARQQSAPVTMIASQSPSGAGWAGYTGPGGGQAAPNVGLSITFVENGQLIAQTALMPGQNIGMRFGSLPDNELVVAPPSGTVSGHHGIISMQGNQCFITDTNSSNGLYVNGMRQQQIRVAPGDVISIGRPQRGSTRCVIVVGVAGQSWDVFPLAGKRMVRIGRVQGNDLVIPDPTVSSNHAAMQYDGTGWTIDDLGSTNGTRVDYRYVTQPTPLFSGQTLTLGNTQIVFLEGCLLLSDIRHGVDVDARNLVRYRKNKGNTIITTDHISLHIKRGEFVAIVGGSGCGKSTILNELNGSEPADEGSVTLDGVDLYANYEMLKSSIGYVPQQDIVYDNLRLEDMLSYAAKLRMQPDTTPDERAARVNEVIDLLELEHVRQNFIGRLSGGQKKRASIAVELLADPRLLFLDEPTSGLDPGIERKLMQTLSSMARDGRTIILVTHTTLNLHLCDQVVFLGYGGKLCYAGDPQEAKRFFGIQDLVDVYNLIAEDPEGWQARFASYQQSKIQSPPPPDKSATPERKIPSFASQFLTLAGRYIHLIINDRSRLLLLLGQGPVLALVIGLVASKDCFGIYEKGSSCMFALSCAAFWVGIFNSIQEICKERDIFKREYEGGVRLAAYVSSKVVVLGGLCILQSAMLAAVFFLTANVLGNGSPSGGLILPSGTVEIFVSLTLLTISAMCLGLMVSALFDNPDRAIALAPLLIMPQILFAGVVFKLEGNANLVSYAVNCRWGIEALGTTLDLDAMDLSMYGEEITIPADDYEVHDIEISPDEIGELEVDTDFGSQKVKPKEPIKIDKKTVHMDEDKKKIDADMLKHDPEELDNAMFTHDRFHLLRVWGILVAFCVVGVAICHLLLRLSVRR